MRNKPKVKNKKNLQKEKNRNIQINDFKQKIISSQHLFIHPTINIKYNNVDMHSWFDKQLYTSNTSTSPSFDVPPNKSSNLMKAKKFYLYPRNNSQINILQQWFNSFIDMYNETITYIKNIFSKDDLRKLLHIKKKIISSKEQLNIHKKQLSGYQKLKISIQKKLQKLFNRKTKTNSTKLSINDHIKALQDIKTNIKKLNIEIANITSNTKQYNSSYKIIYDRVYDSINFYDIRTNKLKDVRDKIKQNSQLTDVSENTQIYTHILDCAIKLACTAYKSCTTNFLEQHTKHFRVKYWSHNKESKILEIETSYIKNHQMAESILGTMDYFYKGKDQNGKKCYLYDLITDSSIILKYDSKMNQYYVYVPESIKEQPIKSEKFVSIDPGIRTFMTCVTNNEVIKYGTNMSDIIKSYLERIDKVKNNELIDHNKKILIVRKYMRIIKNKIDESHWKIINDLTNKYETILIGDLSMKDASNKETSNLASIMKRIGLLYSFYKFTQRLQYKCAVKGIKYKKINEKYTSKMCCVCGNVKEDLGGKKIYKCENCKQQIDRDVGGAIGIGIKAIQ